MIVEKPNVYPDMWYNIAATARKLGISRTTVYKYIKKGIFTPQYGLNNRQIISGEEILKACGFRQTTDYHPPKIELLTASQLIQRLAFL